jgi:hypothetical protein
MSDSTTNIPQMQPSQASKEVTFNSLVDALSPSSPFGRNYVTTSGLVWGYLGGRILVDGVSTLIGNATVTLTASTTNYVEVTRAGVVSVNTTAFTPGRIPLYVIVTGVSTVTSYNDVRPITVGTMGRAVVAMANTNQTLNSVQAQCEMIECTGALTAKRDIIIPLRVGTYTIFANTTGGFGVRAISTSGTGVDIADGTLSVVFCDGTNTRTAALTTSGPLTGSSLVLTGNISSPAWTTNGIRIRGVPATLTDTSSSGTVAVAYSDAFGSNTIAASSATTFTNYIAAFFREPVAGTNVTFTNKWALGAESLRIGTSNQLTVSLAGLLTVPGGAAISNNLTIDSASALQWGSSGVSSPDLFLFRGSANTLEQRSGTNPQQHRLYNTYTDSSNYERFEISWGASLLLFRTAAAGTGVIRNLIFGAATDGASKILFIGASKGIRFGHQSGFSSIEGVDNTGAASYQPLQVGGSALALTISGAAVWNVAATSFAPAVDNSYDIGTTSLRPRTGYFGTSLFVGNQTAAAASEILNISTSPTNTSGSQRTIFVFQTNVPASASTMDNIAMQIRSVAGGTAALSGAAMRGIRSELNMNSGAGTLANYVGSDISITLFGSTVLTNAFGFVTTTFGGTGTVDTWTSFFADDTTATTNTYGFRSALNSGTGKFAFFAGGTANNAFVGNVRIGSTVTPTAALDVTGAGVFSGGVTVGSTTLLTSSVALTNGAGALVGTLTNSPITGNPTKWIPINDNGTTRYIPAW